MIPTLLRNWKLLLTGLAIAALSLMLVFAKADTRHWEKLATAEKAAHAQTVANYRLAAEEARRKDAENVNRVKVEQDKITEEITSDYEARIADARARAAALVRSPAAQANPGSGGAAQLPAASNPAGGPDAASGEDRFPVADRLIATETALRLTALQAWVRAQAGVDPNGGPP